MKHVILMIAVLLAGCADAIDAPSLLPRAIERPFADRVETPLAARDPAETTSVAKLLDQAKRGDAAFAAAMPKGEPAPSQSDVWAREQNAVSQADLAREPARDALDALDKLIAEARAAGRATSADTARATVQAIVDAQNARLEAFTRH